MLCYKLESDEVALFESDVSLKENKDKNVILITNHNIVIETTLIISKKPGNTGISRDIRTEFTTDLLLSD